MAPNRNPPGRFICYGYQADDWGLSGLGAHRGQMFMSHPSLRKVQGGGFCICMARNLILLGHPLLPSCQPVSAPCQPGLSSARPSAPCTCSRCPMTPVKLGWRMPLPFFLSPLQLCCLPAHFFCKIVSPVNCTSRGKEGQSP